MPNETDSPPPRRTATVPSAPNRKPQDRTEPIPSAPTAPEDMSPRKRAVVETVGMLCIPLAGLAAADAIRKPEEVSPWALDIATIEHHAEDLADGVCQLAAKNPVLAAALDKLGTITPFGALLGVVTTIAMQCAENHGSLPDTMRNNPAIGVIPREDFAAMLRERGEQMAATANGNGH